MAGQIRMSPDQMRGRANEYRQQAGKVDEVIKKMDNLLSALQSEWEGAASQSFANRYNELKPGFVKAYELVNEIAAALDASAKVYEDTDQTISRGF